MATTTRHRHFLNCEFGFKNVWTQAAVKNTDGSTYVGHLDRFGNRVGFGTFKMRVDDCIYAAKDLHNRPSLEHWLEYTGVWKDDEPNGFGIMRRASSRRWKKHRGVSRHVASRRTHRSLKWSSVRKVRKVRKKFKIQ
jgi:hypothetical protein